MDNCNVSDLQDFTQQSYEELFSILEKIEVLGENAEVINAAREYAQLRALAHQNRIQGNIPFALGVEEKMQAIYEKNLQGKVNW